MGIEKLVENLSDRQLRLIDFLIVIIPATVAVKFYMNALDYIKSGELHDAYGSIAASIAFAFNSGFYLGKYITKK